MLYSSAPRLCILLVVYVLYLTLGATTLAPSKGEHQAPPPAIVEKRSVPLPLQLASTGLPEDEYSIGDPTDEEQYIVELINLARADANAEAQRLANTTDPDVLGSVAGFSVDLNEMVQQFSTLDQTLPPLSINTELTTMARLHSQDMFNNEFQGHTSSSNPPAPYGANFTAGQRATAVGYNFNRITENVYSFAKSPYHSHAAFEIDWGNGPSGIQDPPGHRFNIHDSAVREVGVGVLIGTNGSVGPYLVTHNFGRQPSDIPFITGVAYYDLNSNNSYDMGEGLGSIIVEVDEIDPWATTASSGGYSIPIQSNGSYTVNFTGLGIAGQQASVNVSNSENVKHDLRLTYTAPDIAGSSTPATGQGNSYTYPSVLAATQYDVNVMQTSNTSWAEGAEDGTNNITITQSTGYNVIQSSLLHSGSNAFQFTHPNFYTDEIVQVDREILVGSSASIDFRSRLRFATSNQSANVDVSIDSGATWANLYNQAGSGGSGESSFIARSISLSAYEGQIVQIRFRYTANSGSVFTQTDSIFGWFVDDITVTNSSIVTSSTVHNNSTATTYNFVPASDGEYLLRVRPVNNSRAFPYGDYLTVIAATSSNNAPVVAITAPADNTTIEEGSEVTFTGTATDTEDGDISASGSWTSDLDGALGSGASLSLNNLSEGTHTITYSATDADLASSNDTLTLVVEAEKQFWLSSNFSSDDLSNPALEATVWGDTADPDQDGVINFLEYALGGQPNTEDIESVLPTLSETNGTLTLTYVKQKADVTYRVQRNATLDSNDWVTTDIVQTPNPDTAAVGTTINATLNTNGATFFMRLEVSQP